MLEDLKPGSSTRYRYDGIQALRFIAAAMVVATHSTFYTHERLDPTLRVWSNGTRGVEIFFVISGFVMIISARRYVGGIKDSLDFFLRRLERVAPLYWLATLSKLTALVLIPAAVLHAVIDPISIIKSLMFIPSRNVDGNIEPLLGVGWTLIFEMFFYSVFAIGLATKRSVYLFVVPVLVVCAVGEAFRPQVYPPWMFYLDTIVLDFLAGMIIGSFTLRGYKLPTYISVLLLVTSALYTLFSTRAFGLPRMIEVDVPAVILVACIVSLEGKLRLFIPKTILTLGSASYAIYLFHSLAAPLGATILRRLDVHNAIAGVILSWTIGVCAGVFVYIIVEKRLDAAIGHASKAWHARVSKRNTV